MVSNRIYINTFTGLLDVVGSSFDTTGQVPVFNSVTGKFSAGTISSTNIYNSDDSLTADRTVTTAGYNLVIDGQTIDNIFYLHSANNAIGIGASPAAGTRFDIRAQGALSTDVPWRIRNSVNTFDLISVRGDGTAWSNGKGGITSNTAWGINALETNTTGSDNSAFGRLSLSSISTGVQNTAVGSTSQRFNNLGSYNTSLGYASLNNSTQNNFTGVGNIGIGYFAGSTIASGSYNTCIGYATGATLRTGSGNTIIGRADVPLLSTENNVIIADGLGVAGSNALWKDANNFIGFGYNHLTATLGAKVDILAQGALSTDFAQRIRNSADTWNIFNAVGSGQVWSNGKGGITTNTAYGESVFESITSGYLNSAFGKFALQSLTSGYENNAFGYMALNSLTSGFDNTAIGYQAGRFITTGTFNTAVGAFALQLNASAFGYNTAIGYASLQDTTGQYNTGLGYQSGKGITSGQYNTYVGFAPATGVTTGSENTIIGSQIGAIGDVSKNVIIADGAGNRAVSKDNVNNVYIGALAALATTATDGFLHIPNCAGAPTGVPTAITGKSPIVIDTTNNKMYIYSGGAWVPLN